MGGGAVRPRCYLNGQLVEFVFDWVACLSAWRRWVHDGCLVLDDDWDPREE